MIEALREIVTIIKDLPAYAVWILAGFLFYKLTVIGSVYGVIRLGINRLFDYLMKDRKQIKEFDLRGIILDEASEQMAKQLIISLRQHNLGYVHSTDIQFAIDAVKEKREREKRG